jgi:hypothetical protein
MFDAGEMECLLMPSHRRFLEAGAGRDPARLSAVLDRAD